MKENTIQKITLDKAVKIGNLVLEAGTDVYVEDKQKLEGGIEYNDIPVPEKDEVK